MDKKTVFVVYGHNKQARDALFSFLRALKLEPIEWRQAERTTGLSSPFVYDIVKSGLDRAQCSVVLFTGDDSVRLRPEYGLEAASFQPRPNVLFETGLAFATGNREGTIVCTFEDTRPISDLGGLLYVQLDNSAPARRNLVQRLQDAGCDVDDSGEDYLHPETGGNFELKYADISPDKASLDRGEFTDFIVDSSLSQRPNNLDLYKELCEYLRDGARIDLKFNYLGTSCASNWLALSEDPTYGHSQLQKLLVDEAEEIVDQCGFNPSTIVDLISLGPGDGIIDRALIHQLQQRIIFGNYYPLDLSFELLQMATSEIANAPWLRQVRSGRRFGIKAIHGDFTELIRYKPIYGYDPSVNIFSLVGYSLGNYNEAELLSKISEGMQLGDYLLLDARLHGIEDFRPGKRLKTDDKEKVLFNYRHATNSRFALGPLETATLVDVKATEMKLDVTTSVTAVPHAVNVITYCTDVSTKFRHNHRPLKRARLNLALTTQYSYDSLVDWLESRDLAIVWKKRVKTTGLFLLRKE